MDVIRALLVVMVCGSVVGLACDDENSPAESAEAVESGAAGGSAEGESGDEGDDQRVGVAAEPSGGGEFAEHHEAIARAACPGGVVRGDGGDFSCGRCPGWTSRGELEDDERAALGIYVGRFTPGAVESGGLEALVEAAGCGHRIDGYNDVAFLRRQGDDWEVLRHSASLGVGNCRRVEVGSEGRSSLVCMRGGQVHQGITSGNLVSYLFEQEGWRRQSLVEWTANAPSGFGEHCVRVEPELRSVDDEEPTEAEITVHVRGRKRERTEDDKYCDRLGDDDWDDRGVVRFRWNGEAFEVPDEEHRALLERNVTRAKSEEVDLEEYLEPAPLARKWEPVPRVSDEAYMGEAAIEGYDPDELPDGIEIGSARLQDEGLAWRDDKGDNRLVVTREERELDGSDKVTAILKVAHWRKPEGGAWSLVRDFREIVQKCNLDLSLGAELGPWSLTDLDEDGIREASFAWSAGCVGGMDPVDHKVLVTEDGDKSILRGETRLRMPLKDRPDEIYGGDIGEREGFDSERRRVHAERVWEATVE